MTLSGMRSHRKARVCPASMSEAQFAVPCNTCRFLCAGQGSGLSLSFITLATFSATTAMCQGLQQWWSRIGRKKEVGPKTEGSRLWQRTRQHVSAAAHRCPKLDFALKHTRLCVYAHVHVHTHTHSCQRNAPKMLTSDKHASVLSPACQLPLCPWQSITFWGVRLWVPYWQSPCLPGSLPHWWTRRPCHVPPKPSFLLGSQPSRWCIISLLINNQREVLKICEYQTETIFDSIRKFKIELKRE